MNRILPEEGVVSFFLGAYMLWRWIHSCLFHVDTCQKVKSTIVNIFWRSSEIRSDNIQKKVLKLRNFSTKSCNSICTVFEQHTSLLTASIPSLIVMTYPSFALILLHCMMFTKFCEFSNPNILTPNHSYTVIFTDCLSSSTYLQDQAPGS